MVLVVRPGINKNRKPTPAEPKQDSEPKVETDTTNGQGIKDTSDLLKPIATIKAIKPTKRVRNNIKVLF